jgi:hypothetical protein
VIFVKLGDFELGHHEISLKAFLPSFALSAWAQYNAVLGLFFCDNCRIQDNAISIKRFDIDA